jgi:hypothetical protein
MGNYLHNFSDGTTDAKNDLNEGIIKDAYPVKAFQKTGMLCAIGILSLPKVPFIPQPV